MAQQGVEIETTAETERPAGLQSAKTSQSGKKGEGRPGSRPAPTAASKGASDAAGKAADKEADKEADKGVGTATSDEPRPLADGDTLAAMIRANQALVDGMTAMQWEILDFGSARLRKDLKTQEEISHCTDMQEAFRVQADFAQDAMRHYAEETAKLIELSNKISRDCWGPLEDAARAAFDTAAFDTAAKR